MIDIGANLTHKSFHSDLPEVLSRAYAAGVSAMVVTGSTATESHAAAALADAHPGRLWATAGVHPHHAATCDGDTVAALRALAARPCVLAIGECGLDFNRDFSPRPLQEEWFARQIELAAELEMPLFMHERDAHERFIDVYQRHGAGVPRAVVHCFTGNREALQAYLELGLYIGVTGWICDERRGLHLRELAGLIPPDRLMIETDAPYLLPRTLKPRPQTRRNEPGFLPEVLRAVALCTGRPARQVAEETSATARRFFGIE